MAAKLRRVNLDSNVQQMNKGLNIQSFLSALLQMRTCTCMWAQRYILYSLNLWESNQREFIILLLLYW